MAKRGTKEEIEFMAEMVTEDPDILCEAVDVEKEEGHIEKKKEEIHDKDKMDQAEKEAINVADVGTIENGIELTDKGMHWSQDGWWYFPRGVPYSESEGGGLKGIYWYKKHRADATKKDPDGKVEEVYLGTDDGDLPFTIPPSFKKHINQVKSQIRSEYGETEEE